MPIIFGQEWFGASLQPQVGTPTTPTMLPVGPASEAWFLVADVFPGDIAASQCPGQRTGLLKKMGTLVADTLTAVARGILHGYADYGRCYGDTSTPAGPTPWREEDLAWLLDMPPPETARDI